MPILCCVAQKAASAAHLQLQMYYFSSVADPDLGSGILLFDPWIRDLGS